MNRQLCTLFRLLIGTPSLILLIPGVANSTLITLEPDDFAVGTDLSSVSPYVELSTSGGGPVYAGPLVGSWGPLDGIVEPDNPFGDAVFSTAPLTNPEWWLWAGYSGVSIDPYDPREWRKEPLGLSLHFPSPVSYFSLLALEIARDAGGGSDIPVHYVYNSSGDLIHYSDKGRLIGNIGQDIHGDDYVYELVEFSYPDISRVLIGGESEPVTLDRLRFRTASVPEPSTIALLCVGLCGLLLCRYSWPARLRTSTKEI